MKKKLVLLVLFAAFIFSCAPALRVHYFPGAPKYPPTSPSSVDLLRHEPGRPHNAFAEIRYDPPRSLTPWSSRWTPFTASGYGSVPTGPFAAAASAGPSSVIISSWPSPSATAEHEDHRRRLRRRRGDPQRPASQAREDQEKDRRESEAIAIGPALSPVPSVEADERDGEILRGHAADADRLPDILDAVHPARSRISCASAASARRSDRDRARRPSSFFNPCT
jgi:hypothetical protein